MQEDILEDNVDLPEGGTHTTFNCPKCGVISQDDVVFLCNMCSQADLILKDGIYMCPDCLKPGENFECMRCGSTKVTMTQDAKDVGDATPVN